MSSHASYAGQAVAPPQSSIGACCGIPADDLLRRLADGLNEVFFCMDLSAGRLVYVSEGYERIWGRSRESLAADPSSWRDAIHPDDSSRVMQTIDECHRTGERYEVEFRITRPDGSVRWIRDRGVPVVDGDGRIVRVVGHAEDVTRHHTASDGIAARPCGTRVRVVVADGRPLIRRGLVAMLERHDDIHVLVAADTAADALQAWSRYRPDVLLLDQRIPGSGQTDVLREVRGADANARVILVGHDERECDIHSALRAGARAFLSATTSEEEVLQCVHWVRDGRSYIPARAASLVADHLAAEPLTTREHEILTLVAQGQSNKQIARVLAISEATVKSHVRRILDKTMAATRTEAAAIAHRRGLVQVGR